MIRLDLTTLDESKIINARDDDDDEGKAEFIIGHFYVELSLAINSLVISYARDEKSRKKAFMYRD